MVHMQIRQLLNTIVFGPTGTLDDKGDSITPQLGVCPCRPDLGGHAKNLMVSGACVSPLCVICGTSGPCTGLRASTIWIDHILVVIYVRSGTQKPFSSAIYHMKI